jgi:hypothetical protein
MSRLAPSLRELSTYALILSTRRQALGFGLELVPA